jgi:hypothetical protein
LLYWKEIPLANGEARRQFWIIHLN